MSIPDPNGVIHGARSNITGDVRIFDNATQSPRIYETELTWNQTGPQGPVGPEGPAGPQGPQGEAGTTDIRMQTFTGETFIPGSSNMRSLIFRVEGRKIISGGFSILKSNDPDAVFDLTVYSARVIPDGSGYEIRYQTLTMVDVLCQITTIPLS